MYYFCTYFDVNYLPRALCLLGSLERHCPPFKLYALCLDRFSYGQIKELDRPHVVPIDLSVLEAAAPELVSVKTSRSQLEYYYTCGPSFLYYLMEHYSEIDVLTLLDADLYFFSTPEPLFRVFDGYSIGVVPHYQTQRRQPPWQGKYNVGWINFRRDPNGLACLEWWRARCLEWCYERYEDGKYADQLYLDQWSQLFKGLCVFTHRGASVAPWNVGDYRLSLQNGQVYVDEDPLIFYHFHGFRKMANNIYDTNLGLTLKPPHPILKRYVFAEYIECLEKHSAGRNPTASIRKYRPKYHIIKSLVRYALGIIFRQYIFVLHGRVL